MPVRAGICSAQVQPSQQSEGDVMELNLGLIEGIRSVFDAVKTIGSVLKSLAFLEAFNTLLLLLLLWKMKDK